MNYEKETTGISTYVSLCSGYDGIGIGLKRAIPNLRTIAHVEIETYAIANLIAKMEAGQLDACPVFTDLKQFPYRELRDRVTILSAGFPCQPFSSAGKRQATEDPRHLYPWIADGITAMRPRYVLLENVEGIISAKTGDGESVLKYVLGDLESRGYTCTWGIFSASEVGAPHQRKRVFILGYAKGAGLASSILGQGEEQLRGAGTWSSETELGNSSSVGSCGGGTDENRFESEVFGSRSEDVAVASSRESRESQTRDGRSSVVGGSEETQWPARPGQEQYGWEPSRTVVTGLGGVSHGTAHRIDRLRLLGNGVVPQTAELAFKTLIKQL